MKEQRILTTADYAALDRRLRSLEIELAKILHPTSPRHFGGEIEETSSLQPNGEER